MSVCVVRCQVGESLVYDESLSVSTVLQTDVFVLLCSV